MTAEALVLAPFTPSQVHSVHWYQASCAGQPIACPRDTCRGETYSLLRATAEGWVCDRCGYTDATARRHMTDWSWNRPGTRWPTRR